MGSIIERIEANRFFDFKGGIHPPEQKFLTNNKPIRSIALAKQLILPLKQHIGKAGDVIVKVGDKVLKGQKLTECSNPMTVPVHAPTSGTITAIKPGTLAHPSAMQDLCLFITPDGNETWVKRNIVSDLKTLTKENVIDKIANAGIAGMGGAGFPTNIKLNIKSGINFLIINAAECEPYITADDLLMQEQASAIINGIEVLNYLLEPKKVLIGIEDNKQKSIAALQKASAHLDHIQVCVLPTKYPTGGEKQLIKALTDIEIKSGSLPINHGMVMQNVGTVFAISEAIFNDTPLIKRVVTVTGQALAKPQNIWAPLGTPIAHLLEQCGYDEVKDPRIIMGGPLMGFTLPNLNVPVVKTTNCILAPTVQEIAPAQKEVECVRCGQCAEVCPSILLPQELQWYAKAKDYNKLEELNLFDCIDCGACAYVCPSQIPLVQYYRVAKAQIRSNKVQQVKADKAKLRFEARNLRLEKEKIAREEKHKKAMAARKAAMSSSEAKSSNDAVAAALARVKAKKAGTAVSTPTPGDSPKARAAAAIERAKAKKAGKAIEAEQNTEAVSPVAAAVARAKAKKAAKLAEQQTDALTPSTEVPAKNDKIASQEPDKDKDSQDKDNQVKQDAAAKRKAAAIAKAKEKALARKAAQTSEPSSESNVEAKTETDGKSEVKVKTAPAKKAAVKKAPVKKTTTAKDKVDKAEAKSTAVTKTATKAPAKSASAKSAPAKSAPAKKAPVKKPATAKAEDKKPAVKKAPVKKAPAKKAPAKKAPAKKAPAKKTAAKKADAPQDDLFSDTTVSTDTTDDVKKQKIAEAIAKAKAKKQAANKVDTEDAQSTTDDAAAIKKQRISEAIAKAKAKKKNALDKQDKES
ncbi:electron transport complex subunit RsxC [Thalassotalea crassostreae]|uniref:electron transport complex subunit RsxC n=1 Tax=Thalassotalea crassostreae TaxID=1763536 RepID=UPI0008389ADD|nr:electron transport complex subunit RsxC [Thalassotalea crassostreae]